MKNSVINNRISGFAVLLPVLVSLFVTTGVNIDPVNIPKMVLLVIGSGYLLGLILSSRIHDVISNKLIFISTGLFILGILVSTLFSKSPFSQLVFGSYGRNTGAITYLALAILLVATYLINNPKYVDRFLIGLFSAGLFNACYGMLQLTGNDPVDWNNTFNAIIGTFGNPNFSSAFIALSLLTYPVVYRKLKSHSYKYLLVPTFILSSYAIIRTSSQQGYLLIAIGISILLLTYLFKRYKLSFVSIGALGLVAIGALAGLLGFLQIGPFGKILYQPSISLRGFYWNSGISMFKSSPFFGHGLDSYGDLYLRNRSSASILPPGGTQVYSNAAHNVFIDIAASGGVLMLIPYLALIVYALILVFRVLRTKDFNLVFTTLLGVWAAFLVQSVISINQIGLAVWIWATTGIVIAYSLILLGAREEEKPSITKKRKGNQETSAGAFLSGFVFVLIFGAMALPEQVADMNYKAQMEKRNVPAIIKIVNSHPLSSERMSRTAQVFLRNSLNNEALQISLKAVEFNPDHLNSWITLAYNPAASLEQRKLAKSNLMRIDPRSPEWRELEIK